VARDAAAMFQSSPVTTGMQKPDPDLGSPTLTRCAACLYNQNFFWTITWMPRHINQTEAYAQLVMAI